MHTNVSGIVVICLYGQYEVCLYLLMMMLCAFIYFFFFQAEDGIRDVERSRGLGDVYKRQDYTGI